MGTGLVVSVLGLVSSTPNVITNMPANHSETILFDGQKPGFVVELPALRLIPPVGLGAKLNKKPSIGSALMTYLLPAIQNFWPLWEDSGTTAADIVGSNTATVSEDGGSQLSWSSNIVRPPTPDIVWPPSIQPALCRQGVLGTTGSWNQSPWPVTTPGDPLADMQLATPLVLSGEWSFDFCWRLPFHIADNPGGAPSVPNSQYWNHTVVTNDPVNGVQGYTNGAIDPNWATALPNAWTPAQGHVLQYPLTNDTPLTTGVYATSFTITGLLQAIGYKNHGFVELEYFRVWRRVLNLVEIQSLALDPFCMFGVTTEMLDEITNIIEFMAPAKERWFYVFTA